MLTAESITVRRGGRRVIDGVSLTLRPGERVAIIGPNGSGKSTLLHAVAGLLPLAAGRVTLDGNDIRRLSRRAIARGLALLPQQPEAPEGLTLAQLVHHARFAHRGLWGVPGPQDRAAVSRALHHSGADSIADRPFSALSGGERQRGWLALALAQEPRLLLLDEPTTFLDLGHQQQVIDLLTDLPETSGVGFAAVLHDVNHATALADRIIALHGGAVIADGPPLEIVTKDLLQDLFGVRLDLVDGPAGLPICVLNGRRP